MVTEALLDLWASIVAGFAAVVSLPAPPAFVLDLGGYVATVAGYVASTGSWIPWPLLVAIIGVWVAALTAAVTVKLVRIVASFLTAGGGSAA